MSSRRGRLWVWILIVASFGSVAAAMAEKPREERAELRLNQWVRAFAKFAEKHPDLTPEQMTVIWSAFDVATSETFVMDNGLDRWAREEGVPIGVLLRRAQKYFSNDELGELFTGMGSLQKLLADAGIFNNDNVYCNCTNPGSFCDAPYPNTAFCDFGCISWSSGGRDYVGFCNAAN